MRKIWTIAWKDLVATFTDRNLLVIMILTPLLLATIIALAFGGGGDPDGLSLAAIPIVIVNQDAGLDVAGELNVAGLDGINPAGADLEGTLFDLGFTPDGALDSSLNSSGDSSGGDAATAFNAGDVIASILAPASVDEGSATGLTGGADLPTCTLFAGNSDEAESGGFNTTLEELFAPTLLDDPAAARAAVDTGDFVAAVIIPPGFSQSILPVAQFGPASGANQAAPAVTVEVYANAGNPIEATIVRSVVEAVVNQFGRMGVTLLALGDSVGQTVANSAVDLAALDVAIPPLTAPVSEWQAFLDAAAAQSPWLAALAAVLPQLTAANAPAAADEAGEDSGGMLGDEIGGAIACLFDPDAGAVTIARPPLNRLQEQSFFAQVMVQVGSAQAVFFALFTGAFGILSIYQERKQWTLQRMLVSPTSRTSVLSGFLAGNVIVVWAQLLLLMFFMTVISSAIIGRPTFIWGDQWLLLLLLTAVISLCVAGLGVLVVGVARTPEQVQVFAPVINMFLGALGGAFGFALPTVIANLSLITWATDAFGQLAAGQSDIRLHLGVLLLQGAVFFGIGLWFFRRRLEI